MSVPQTHASDPQAPGPYQPRHHALLATYCLSSPLPALEDVRQRLAEESAAFIEESGAHTRGWYDTAGLRADADLLVWWTDPDPVRLMDANHRLRASTLGCLLDPVWSCLGSYSPAEAGTDVVPACFSGTPARTWLTVYPFASSDEWHRLPQEEADRLAATFGLQDLLRLPDVGCSRLSSFGVSDYEGLLALESDNLGRLQEATRDLRANQAHLHQHMEGPSCTGMRVSPAQWVEQQPRV